MAALPHQPKAAARGLEALFEERGEQRLAARTAAASARGVGVAGSASGRRPRAEVRSEHVPQCFDIVYRSVQVIGYSTPDTYVMKRRVEAIDRTHALLWWIRNELGLNLDPVEMFDDYKPECGCEFFIACPALARTLP